MITCILVVEISNALEPPKHSHVDSHCGDSTDRCAFLYAVSLVGSGSGAAVRRRRRYRFTRWLSRTASQPDLASGRIPRSRGGQTGGGGGAGAAVKQGCPSFLRPYA